LPPRSRHSPERARLQAEAVSNRQSATARRQQKGQTMPGNKEQPGSAPFLQVLSIPLLMAAVVVLVVLSAGGVHLVGLALGGQTHGPVAIYGFAAVCTFLTLWLVLGQVFAYLNVGQAKKIEIITGFYTPDTIADYFEQFWSGRDGMRGLVARYRNADDEPAKTAAGAALEAKLKELFAADFGLAVYIVPVIIFIAAGAIVLFLGYVGGIGLGVSLSTSQPPPVQPFGLKLDLVSIAAIFGAYTWIASDVIVRNHQWTLHPSDLGWYALRLIVAIPLGQALALTVSGGAGAAALPTGAGAFVAFVASMFSLDAITTALGTAATRFGVQMSPSKEERDDLIVKLAGVDQERARALDVEGVSTIAQLVCVDPIRTSIRTGLAFEYILNLIDAALLWVFVGNKLPLLSPFGLRGASDVLALDEAWNAPSTTALAALRQADASLAQKLDDKDKTQSALTAEQAKPAPDQAEVTTLEQAVTAAAAVVATAEAARAQALVTFLAAPGMQPDPTPDRTAMLAALAKGAPDGGAGLASVGFDTIAERLRKNSYANFVRRLLES
jgi:hypothetical protein